MTVAWQADGPPVNAWACRNRIALGRLAVDAKFNAFTAIPKLMKLLLLEGYIVTIARQIIAQKADYLLTLKDNHPTFHDKVEEHFACSTTLQKMAAEGAKIDPITDHEKAHGRQETRRCTVLEKVDWYREHWQWEGLRSLVIIESTRQEGSKPASIHRRFYLISRGAEAAKILASIRSHWAIETSLHWVLDVIWREDHCRARIGHSAEIFSLMRKMAINRLQHSPRKDSMRGKQCSAGWSQSYLLELLKL
jgi:predicted transposase YbfD/YdcC